MNKKPPEGYRYYQDPERDVEPKEYTYDTDPRYYHPRTPHWVGALGIIIIAFGFGVSCAVEPHPIGVLFIFVMIFGAVMVGNWLGSQAPRDW